MKMRKPVKAIAKSPKVSLTEGKMSIKYAMGSAGRAFPANIDKRCRGNGNPCGAKKSY